jgi:transcriptional regulator with XRE-family HTH domain
MTEHKSAPTFGRFLKFWRSVHEVSQEELAFRLDRSPRHISRIENGISRLSESIILEIGRVLELGNRDWVSFYSMTVSRVNCKVRIIFTTSSLVVRLRALLSLNRKRKVHPPKRRAHNA